MKNITTIAAILTMTVGVNSCSRQHPLKGLDAQRLAVVAEPGIPWQLQFTVRTLDGTPFAGANLYGRPAVLWFWAPERPEAGK